jgi:hydroxymethylpyrimidine pyrophosphatase-like HAD family hydrolase
MERYDQLYSLYDEFDTDSLRAHQDFVGVFPPVDSRVALSYWEDAREELETGKGTVRDLFPEAGDAFAEVVAHATRDQAFTALDLLGTYDRGVNVLVLDVDETLRSAGGTDNEIPRETLWLLTKLHESGLPVVICTGQTLENVKGFLIQGLGSELVYSGDVSVVYEAGSGVFTPGHGPDTKRLLYDDLDSEVRAVFDAVRSRVLSEAPTDLRQQCHLQGNEFNVTMKPNYETGSERARAMVDAALVYELDLLGDVVAETLGGVGTVDGFDATDRTGDVDPGEWARAFYADADPEIAAVLESEHATPELAVEDVPAPVGAVFERVDIAYYEADAAEVGSLELNKVAGVEAALDVLGVADPFAFVMGDSKTDLRVMRWAEENDAGIAAAPEHAADAVLDHVRRTDELVYGQGDAAEPLRTVYALHCLAGLA